MRNIDLVRGGDALSLPRYASDQPIGRLFVRKNSTLLEAEERSTFCTFLHKGITLTRGVYSTTNSE